jgi:hypothetical protein
VADKQTLHDLIEQLPAAEVRAAERYLRFLIAHDEPPVEPEMLARIDAARAHPSGEVLPEFEV